VSLNNIERPDSEKISPYECGFEPYGDARQRFDISFYLIGILFIIFDLEMIESNIKQSCISGKKIIINKI